ncbi:MAG: 2-oxoglutarate dehydrogenase E1 component, partial [Patiriisocius sp.]
MDKYSFLNAAHPAYIAEIYDKYLKFPDSVEPSWRAFFQGFDFGVESGSAAEAGFADAGVATGISQSVLKEFAVIKLIDGYRTRGHLFTKTNPVRNRRIYKPTLAIENFGLSKDDLNTRFKAGEIIGLGEQTLESIIKHLVAIYCESIGVEYMYIRNPKEITWIQNWLNENDNHPQFDPKQKKHILGKLNQALSFETFLHSKYVGQKRFSIEGVDALIPGLDALMEQGAEQGVEQFVVGMAHRGRLNVLANIFGKSPEKIFSEFDGKEYDEAELFDGDVKYHMGWTSIRDTDGGKRVRMDLAPNPSHLETVNAVVGGIARAKMDNQLEGDSKKLLPILIHGDAAIAGQGVVYEFVQMAQLEG